MTGGPEPRRASDGALAVPDRPDPAPSGGLQRTLGLFSTTTLIVGSMIGSGIFIAPSIMATQVASPTIYLGLWIVGGLLTLLGALSYGELAAMLPRAGGQYVYLREAFGQATAFLYGWALFFVIQTGLNAAVAIGFAKYMGVLGLPIGEDVTLVELGPLRLSTAQGVATAALVVLTAINCYGVKAGAFVQNLFTVLKLSAIVVLIVACFSSDKGSFDNFATGDLGEVGPAAAAASIGFFAAMAVAMSKVLFAYDAWNTVTFVAEEVKEPAKNLPRGLLWGTVATTLAYTGAAAAYLYVLPLPMMAGVAENRVGAEVATIVMGTPGRIGLGIAILISTFGCINGLILGGARVLLAMARDRVFLPVCAEVHPRFHTPVPALLMQGAWSVLLALTGRYDSLLTYITFASLAFNMLTVAAVLVLRRTRPDLPRPYRVQGYPVTPLVFLAGSAFFLVYILVGAPTESLMGVALVAVGLPVYWLMRRRAA